MDPPKFDEAEVFAIELGITPKNVRPLHKARLHRGWIGMVDMTDLQNNVFGFITTIKDVPFFVVFDLRTFLKNIKKNKDKWYYMADVYVFDKALGRLVKVGRPSVRKQVKGKFSVEPSDFYKQIVRANSARKQFLGEGWW